MPTHGDRPPPVPRDAGDCFLFSHNRFRGTRTMNRNTQVRRAVQHALLISAVAAAAPSAFAQSQEGLESIVVTGSRIKSANLEGTTPVTTVTSADIATQGVTRVEDLLTQLPQAFTSQNATVSNGATGAATVDLRNLGDARTLVLVNGRRLPYGSTSSSAADLNSIPAALVERVEVLTGGASAIYGSDAVSGVVNFIMKKDFEGVQIDAQWGTYQHHNSYGGPGDPQLRDVIAARGETNPSAFALPDSNVTDGESQEINITMGVSTDDGRGNLTAYAGWRKNKAILQADRDYSACTLNANPVGSFSCGGSSTSYPGRFVDFYTPGLDYTIDQTTGNTFRPFSSATDQYNFGPLNYYQRPDERWSAGVMGHYEMAELADVYTELMYTNYKSVAQIAPGGYFFTDDKFGIPCNNPELSHSQATALGCTDAMIADPAGVLSTPIYIGRRNVEGGGRQDSFDNTSFRGLVGIRGNINKDWDYDTSFQYSKGTGDTRTLNYFVKDRIPKAFDVVPDPVTGAPVCRSVLDGTDPACVPYNIFQIGGVTPEALNYLQAPALQTTEIQQEIITGAVTGDLGGIGLQSPFASEGIKVVFGAEHRTDKLSTTPDYLQTNNLLSGAGGATIGFSGVIHVTDLFTELRVPIVQGAPFADQLGFDAAYRYSDYSTPNLTTDTYKFGLDWAPVPDVKLRGTYQRAVRAPNIIELFTQQGFNLFDLSGDPCGAALAGGPGAAADADCLASGVPVARLRSSALDSPAGQYQFLQGGVQDLVPETSDTYTFGVILQPRFLPKMAFSVDYFDIKIDDAISTFGADNRLNACYFQHDAESCSKIHRAGNGILYGGNGYVEDLNANLATLSTKGYDFNLTYSDISIGRFGSLNVNITGTLLDELITKPATIVDEYDCVGMYSNACEEPTPEWRHHARLGWTTPWNLDFSLTWRYFGSVDLFRPAVDNTIDAHLKAQSYFDLAANWAITDKISIMAGIDNVLDEDPPITSAVGTTGNGNTFPQVYDALGRFGFLRAQIGF